MCCYGNRPVVLIVVVSDVFFSKPTLKLTDFVSNSWKTKACFECSSFYASSLLQVMVRLQTMSRRGATARVEKGKVFSVLFCGF
jgi:hypothetical protein